MRTKVVLVLAAVFMLVVGGTAVASNMGFKITIPLAAGGYSNWVSLPYYNSYTTAASIFGDITGCTQVSRWDNPSGTYQSYTGGRGTGFNVTPGEAYLIKVSSATDWIVVGSHDPSLALTLSAGGASNWVSIPYHTTATTASGLFGQIPNCTQVSRWDNPSGTYQSYTGGRGTGFNLTPGEGLLIKVNANESWTPLHY